MLECIYLIIRDINAFDGFEGYDGYVFCTIDHMYYGVKECVWTFWGNSDGWINEQIWENIT